jgi:hypothetical protein
MATYDIHTVSDSKVLAILVLLHRLESYEPFRVTEGTREVFERHIPSAVNMVEGLLGPGGY